MTFALIVVFASYLTLVTCLTIGWRRAINTKREVHKPDQFTSVIIPIRNEEANIGFLLDDLFNQNISSQNFEIILVDDHSEDKTIALVQEKLKNRVSNCRIIQSTGQGKKTAITTGIQQAKGNIIVTADADCRVTSTWLHSITSAFASKEIKMVFGPVRIQPDQSLFSKLQAIEFSSLIASGAATLEFGMPTMCNGANLAYRKDVFQEVGGYDDNLKVASGDDEFLMRRIFKKYPKGICFNNDQDGIISTQPQQSLSQFIYQRIRWAGKWKSHNDLTSKLLALYVFAFHTIVLLLPILFITRYISGYEILSFLILKLTAEFIFLYPVTAWLNIRWHWLSFILLQLLYPVYAIGVGLASLFLQPSWKGRK
jgi:cellulose synthase/poly-beta-1,6-N-acetylglucosamine synthase-like glycosyltransferase